MPPCCKGTLNPIWKAKPVDFCTFREKLGKQVPQHNPAERKRPGDEKSRVAAQQPKKRRHTNVSQRLHSEASVTTDLASSTTSELTRDRFQSNTKRLCGDLTHLRRHVQSAKPTDSSGQICVVCGSRCLHSLWQSHAQIPFKREEQKERKHSLLLSSSQHILLWFKQKGCLGK